MDLWNRCKQYLEDELPAQEFNTWILPLQSLEETNRLRLFAPNRFVMDWFIKNHLEQVDTFIKNSFGESAKPIDIEIGSKPQAPSEIANATPFATHTAPAVTTPLVQSNINREFTFDNFVEGKSNQLARAASIQIGENPGKAYNPLFIYGGVGLGKTHLMHAVGNTILENNPSARVVYLHSEGFVSEMVKALQHGTIDDFKRKYRSVNALLIDDIQFFAGKERSQEEFFHTFNTLFESKQQIILSSDKFPKEVKGLEERLKSRFGWGLTVSIDPPDLETRVAILKSKSQQIFNIELPDDVAFFVGERVISNIRELEGALRRIIANSRFTGKPITIEFAKEALKDMIAAHAKQVTIPNIQRVVCEYYQIRSSDLLSKKRSRSIARPRQVAMTLSKELTNHSLPEIGEAFGGRDHTTVLYATRKIAELRESEPKISEDYSNLLRSITS